jgi:signal transduction histidine kinase/ligand-binding sensor domain-containing protein
VDSWAGSGTRSPLRILLFVIAAYAVWPLNVRAVTNHPSHTIESSVRGRTPVLTPSDYIRTVFTVENGLPNNIIQALVQTKNGVLWIGTDSGLASFDGRAFKQINLQTEGPPPPGSVHSLLESSEGDLWVGCDGGVVRISKTGLDQFSPTLLTFFYVGPGSGDAVEVLLQSRDGALWAGTKDGLYRENSGKFVVVIPNVSINRIAEALSGHLLVTTNQGRVLEWNGHEVVNHPDPVGKLGVPEADIFEVFQDHDGTMWFSTRKGILRWGNKPLPRLRPPGVPATTAVYRTYEDPQGYLWVLFVTGMYRVNGDVVEETPVFDVRARSFCADRDGGFWVGTNGNGLIHLVRRVVYMFTRKDGLLSDIPMTVLASHDGRLWAGLNCGLAVYDGKRFKPYAEKEGLSNSCVWSLAEDRKGSLWIATYGGGLFRFRDGRFTQYSLEQGVPSKVVFRVIVAHDDSVWIATPDGVGHMEAGRFRTYTTADGLSSNQALSVFQDRSDTIWAATQVGINRLVGERFVRFPSEQPRAGPLSIGFAQDFASNLYTLDSPKGISLIRNNELIVVNKYLNVLDMVESPHHDLWFSGISGILRINSSDLEDSLANQNTPLDYELIDRADGLNSAQCSSGSPNMAITPDNKLWVATVKGLAVLDLAQLPRSSRAPKVFIEAVVDGETKTFSGNEAVLSPGSHHVELHLEAVDIASPEKVHLQYRLDGVDPGWLNANASQMAVYTNIPTGSHTFHVRASNSSGVWDRNGVSYSITQHPYFYQTDWFLALCVALIAFLAWSASQWRVQQAKARAQMQMEERLSERARIARDLHDTLLQGVQGLMLQFHVAAQEIPQGSRTRVSMERALATADRILREGRDRVTRLRLDNLTHTDLTEAFEAVAADFNREQQVRFSLKIEGRVQDVIPSVLHELYYIGREAIGNAFRHSNASVIAVSLNCGPKSVDLIVDDNGCGFDLFTLQSNPRRGHWGLQGMKERAEVIGATFKCQSTANKGTQVIVVVPLPRA